MGKGTRICKVCGKEYPYCKTELKIGEIFRWQDVACCAEHGAEYFAEVAAARGEVFPGLPELMNIPAGNEDTKDGNKGNEESNEVPKSTSKKKWKK